ncbi:MAG: hypothetical protein IKZ34_01645, partial [Alphaproteobacteria bacterium]|nr:hypothetical protein [Alphaproteobacteria bacterium]
MKILVALLGLFVVTGAFAEDTVDVEEDVTVEESVSVEETGNVVERVACDDIKTKIADLTALEEPTEDEIAELEKLKQEQRTKCMRSASKRKASVAKKVVVEASAAIEEEAEEVEE